MDPDDNGEDGDGNFHRASVSSTDSQPNWAGAMSPRKVWLLAALRTSRSAAGSGIDLTCTSRGETIVVEAFEEILSGSFPPLLLTTGARAPEDASR